MEFGLGFLYVLVHSCLVWVLSCGSYYASLSGCRVEV